MQTLTELATSLAETAWLQVHMYTERLSFDLGSDRLWTGGSPCLT